MINYKFREGELLSEIKEYVDATYSQHYGGDKIQTSEVIVDRGRGMGFFLGNVDNTQTDMVKKVVVLTTAKTC